VFKLEVSLDTRAITEPASPCQEASHRYIRNVQWRHL